MSLIKPQEVEIVTMDGDTRKYTISRIPAIAAREIVAQYSMGAIPKIGEYATNEAMMLKMMRFVAVEDGERSILLENKALVDNHVPDWETLAKLEMEVIKYNTSFFQNGKGLNFLEAIARKAEALISKTLTDLLAQSSKTDKQPSES